MTNNELAEEIYGQLIWDSFTLDSLRYIFAIQNEPVFQSAVASLVRTGRVTTVHVNGELGLATTTPV